MLSSDKSLFLNISTDILNFLHFLNIFNVSESPPKDLGKVETNRPAGKS